LFRRLKIDENSFNCPTSASKITPPSTTPRKTINMGLTEIRNICEVSLDIPAEKQPKLHNRWHPDIPFADTIKNGETVKIECVSIFHQLYFIS
jgi:hypothetical protein